MNGETNNLTSRSIAFRRKNPQYLERIVQLDYPLIVGFGQNISFGLDVSHLQQEKQIKKPISGQIGIEMNEKFSKIPSSGNLPDQCTHLIPLEDVRLPQRLHGVQVIRVDLPHQGHFTKGSDTDGCQKKRNIRTFTFCLHRTFLHANTSTGQT